MIQFVFYGRVSTEDQQDPQASRNWQLARARALIERHRQLMILSVTGIGAGWTGPRVLCARS
jgi:hypothetical protein